MDNKRFKVPLSIIAFAIFITLVIFFNFSKEAESVQITSEKNENITEIIDINCFQDEIDNILLNQESSLKQEKDDINCSLVYQNSNDKFDSITKNIKYPNLVNKIESFYKTYWTPVYQENGMINTKLIPTEIESSHNFVNFDFLYAQYLNKHPKDLSSAILYRLEKEAQWSYLALNLYKSVWFNVAYFYNSTESEQVEWNFDISYMTWDLVSSEVPENLKANCYFNYSKDTNYLLSLMEWVKYCNLQLYQPDWQLVDYFESIYPSKATVAKKEIILRNMKDQINKVIELYSQTNQVKATVEDKHWDSSVNKWTLWIKIKGDYEEALILTVSDKNKFDSIKSNSLYNFVYSLSAPDAEVIYAY